MINDVKVKTGLDILLGSPPVFRNKRLGLLCNPASTGPGLIHSRSLLQERFPDQLKALYSPQHGFFAEKQDNMIESGNRRDPVSGLPVFSLYGGTRIPTPEMLDLIDILIIDLQDVGTRVYTFIYTIAYCMEAAKKSAKKVVVLDRPNPIGGRQMEGNCLNPEMSSFVGRFPIPMRHGLTIGELALFFNRYYKMACDLEVIPMSGWHRQMYYKDTGLDWIAPSPNMPTPVTAMVYPGQVLWEGTNVSEGRGTTQPFELFGAPYMDTDKLRHQFNDGKISGGILRAVEFEPTSNKWTDQICKGFQIHVTDPDCFKPYETSLRLLQTVCRNHSSDFEWKPPPYEYEMQKMPIDLIIGDKNIRKQLEDGMDVNIICERWQDQLSDYISLAENIMLY